MFLALRSKQHFILIHNTARLVRKKTSNANEVSLVPSVALTAVKMKLE